MKLVFLVLNSSWVTLFGVLTVSFLRLVEFINQYYYQCKKMTGLHQIWG